MMKFNFSRNKTVLFAGFVMFCLVFQPTVFAAFPKNAMLDTSFTLKIEETTNIDSELQLTVLDDVSDSRCPSDVTCVWEGVVSVQVNLLKDGQNLGNHTIQLGETEYDKQIFDGYYVKLVAVEPYPLSTTQITPSDYVMTFLVSKISKTETSPLKQLKAGISIDDIQCKEDLVLVMKSSNSSPACVQLNTAEKLFSRGWAEIGNTSFDIIIKTGTFAGHCIGYCSKEFVVTPEKIIYSQNGQDFVSGEWAELLEKTKETQFSQTEWNELTDLIDFEQLSSIPDKIGCPGCVDAPVEWIEISHNGKTKRIEFENGAKIPEISKLIVSLQEIRNRAEFIDSFEECVLSGHPVMESYPRQCRTDDGRSFVEEIDSMETPHETGKRPAVTVPDATTENDLFCNTLWNIETMEKLESEYIKNSVQSTIAQFGITYFLEDREIIVSQNSSGYVVSISGLWYPESIQYSMITEDLENISGVDVHGEPAMCQ